MTSPTEAIQEFLKFAGTLAVLTGTIAKWWRSESLEEDEVISAAANELLDGLSNADLVNKVQDSVGINLREQATIEEVQEWHRERQLRSWRNRN